MTKRHFRPDLFRFLSDLAENNQRGWWEENRQRYVELVRDPALDFITDFQPRLERISPRFVADSRTVGGSLMRPHRDTRFSPDKTPYKTNVGVQFRHESARDVHAPGFYLHLEPVACFASIGLWRPEAAVARRIRQAIHDDPPGWEKATGGAFVREWSVDRHQEDMLRRIPRELDHPHPRPDDLRLKTFTATSRLTQKEVTSAGFDELLAGRFAAGAPLVSFLCTVLGLPF